MLILLLAPLERLKLDCVGEKAEASYEVDRDADQPSAVAAEEVARVGHLELDIVGHGLKNYSRVVAVELD